MKRRNYIFAVLFSLLSSSGYAGVCYIHTDKGFYVSGETVWYKIYLPQSFRSENVSFQITLIDFDGSLVDRYWLKNDGECFLSGKIVLPFSVHSGTHHLLLNGSGKEDGRPIVLARKAIPIYDDLSSDDTYISSKILPHQRIPAGPLNDELEVLVELDSENIKRRDLVKGRIILSGNHEKLFLGNASISVTDVELVGKKSAKNDFLPVHFNEKLLASDLTDHIMLQGLAMDSNGEPAYSSPLAYFSTTEQDLKYSKTSVPGYFAIPLEPFWGKKQYQLMDYKQDEFVFSLYESYVLETEAITTKTPTVVNYVKWSRARKKIAQYFLDSLPYSAQEEEYKVNVWTDYRRMDFSKYESFKDLPTFCTEVKNPLDFNLGPDGLYESDFFVNRYGDVEATSGPALFIVDGKLTRNADFVARMDINKLSHMDLFFDLKKLLRQFGPLGMNGVAIIKTKSGTSILPSEEEDNIFVLSGYQRGNNFSYTRNESSPVFRPLIHWQSDLLVGNEESVEFEFQHTDDIGEFQIEIMIQGPNGEMGYTTLYYEVTK